MSRRSAQFDDRPLRVAITTRAIAPWHGRGGLERHVADLVRHLLRQNVRIILIAPPPKEGELEPCDTPDAATDSHEFQVRTVPYTTFPGSGRRGTTILDRCTAYPLFGWRAGRLAAQLAAAGGVDIVHGLGASVLGYALAKRRNSALPPFILNPQGLEEFGATDPARAGLKVRAYWPLQQVVRICAREADAVLATDAALIPVVIQHLGIESERVRLMPNAVDLERCDGLANAGHGRRVRIEHSVDSGTPVLLSVGRIEESKGFQVLVEALRRLQAQGREWHWILIGDGPFRPSLMRLIEAAGFGSRMIWLGPVSDPELHAWYEAADVFVHPTLYEGSSLVTLEAMAHRRPVVASRAGGLPDKVEPGITGWLVPPGDADRLAQALAAAFDSPERWEELGSAGRRLVERTFAWPAVAARLVALYRALCAGVENPSPHGDKSGDDR